MLKSHHRNVFLCQYAHRPMISYYLTPRELKQPWKSNKYLYIHVHTHTHTALSITQLQQPNIRACHQVCMCCVHMCKLDSMCVLKATVMCWYVGRSGHSPRQLWRFDPCMSSSHLSVDEIHREQRDRSCWHMHGVYRKPVMGCRVTGRQRGYGCIK